MNWLLTRLLHIHYWLETDMPDPMVFMNGKFIYRCRDCSKQKSFRDAPVNYTESE